MANWMQKPIGKCRQRIYRAGWKEKWDALQLEAARATPALSPFTTPC